MAESSRERDPAAMPTALKLAVSKPAPQPVVAPVQPPNSRSPAPVSEAAPAPAPAPAASMAPVAVNRPTAPEIKPAPLRRDQLNGLVASLAEQYQRGDLENLLALFDASAHFERGDKKQIRAEYGELFRDSENRALYIWDVTWSGDGKVDTRRRQLPDTRAAQGRPLATDLQRRGDDRGGPAQRPAADRRPVSQGG